MHSIGWWKAEKKDADGNDRLIELLAAESLEAIQKSIGEFHKNAEWQRVEEETKRDRKLHGAFSS